MTVECGFVLLTRVFSVFTLTKCYTCNTIHHRKSLYFFVVEKNNVHKNVKCSRFKCPYCNSIRRKRSKGLENYINNLMSLGQNNQRVKDVKVNDISIRNSNEIHFSTVGPRLAREIPLTSDDESIYLNTQREYSSKPLKHSIVYRILVFKL